MDARERAKFAQAIRRTVIDQSYRANVGHIGSALSISDLLAAVIGGPARLDGDANRDRIVLSKGHAALALYAALDLRGRLDRGAIDTYCGDGTLLGVHPEHELDGIDFCTGSLGQGGEVLVSARLPPDEGLTVLASRYHGSSTRLDAFLEGKRVAKLINFGSSVKFCRLAEGIADLYPRFGRTMEWDTCAPQAVLEAAGGTVRTLEGEELRYGKPGWENPHFVCTGRLPT